MTLHEIEIRQVRHRAFKDFARLMLRDAHSIEQIGKRLYYVAVGMGVINDGKAIIAPTQRDVARKLKVSEQAVSKQVDFWREKTANLQGLFDDSETGG